MKREESCELGPAELDNVCGGGLWSWLFGRFAPPPPPPPPPHWPPPPPPPPLGYLTDGLGTGPGHYLLDDNGQRLRAQ
jgi:hypothetical protein